MLAQSNNRNRRARAPRVRPVGRQAQLIAGNTGVVRRRPRRRQLGSAGNGPVPGPRGPSSNSSFGGMRGDAAAVALGREQRVAAPMITRSARGMRIRHRELVGTVNGSIAFSATKFACNPGMAATFPWLAPQAVQWEQYRFHKLSFEYITRTATSTVGSVLLAPDYDAADPAPTTEAQASSFEDSVENVAWKDLRCDLSPDSMFPIGPRKFIRSGAQAGDLKTFDAASLFLCVVEETGASAIGKLWVEYDVEFFVPQNSPSSQTNSIGTDYYSRATAQTFTTATPAAIAWDAASAGLDPLLWGTPAAGVFTPPAGAYDVAACVTINDSAAEAFSVTISVLKNGSQLSPPISSSVASSVSLGANAKLFVSLRGVCFVNGTDTLQVSVTATGAAGTLTSVANGPSLVASLA